MYRGLVLTAATAGSSPGPGSFAASPPPPSSCYLSSLKAKTKHKQKKSCIASPDGHRRGGPDHWSPGPHHSVTHDPSGWETTHLWLLRRVRTPRLLELQKPRWGWVNWWNISRIISNESSWRGAGTADGSLEEETLKHQRFCRIRTLFVFVKLFF